VTELGCLKQQVKEIRVELKLFEATWNLHFTLST
jgi:hypothetical protein